MIATLSSSLMAASREREWRCLVSRTRSPLPKSGVDRRRWQGATTRNSWRYSEEEQRSQRRRGAPEFGDGLRVRDTRNGRRIPGRPDSSRQPSAVLVAPRDLRYADGPEEVPHENDAGGRPAGRDERGGRGCERGTGHPRPAQAPRGDHPSLGGPQPEDDLSRRLPRWRYARRPDRGVRATLGRRAQDDRLRDGSGRGEGDRLPGV